MTEPSQAIPPRLALKARLAIVLMAAAAQALLLYAGFYSSAADESARALGAWDARFVDLIEPDVWPPFYEVLNGFALRVFNNLFVTPRVLAFVAGLMVLWALMSLADRIFKDARITALTGIIGAFLPHRLLFSVAPMSEIYLFLFLILAATSVFEWLEDGRDHHAVLAGVWFGIATTIRYEAWVAGGLFAAFVFYRIVRTRGSALVSLLAAMIIPLVFPAMWLTSNLVWPSDIHFFSITSQQAATANPNFLRVVYNTATVQMALDILLAPGLIAGVVALLGLARRQAGLRWWSLVVFSPVAVVTAAGLVTGSVPFAAPWRLGGAWTLLLIPFFAYAVLHVFEQRSNRWRVVGAATLVVLTLLPIIGRSAHLATNSKFSVEELELGREVGDLIADRGGKVLIEPATGFSFLDVIVASNRPDAFELTIGPDPYLVALFISRPDAWRRLEPELANTYLAVNYDFTRGVDPEDLACAGIVLVMTFTTEQTAAAMATTGLTSVGSEAGWTLFEPAVPCG